MSSGRWFDLPLRLRVVQALCVLSVAIGAFFAVFTDETALPWVFVVAGGLGGSLVAWRANARLAPPPPPINRDRERRWLPEFLTPPRSRLAQLQEQNGEGLLFEYVTVVPLETTLGEVLAPKSGALRTTQTSHLAHSGEYRVRVKVKGTDVRLTPSSQMYSWQPIFKGRAEHRDSGTALTGRISWSGPTQFFTLAFPFLGLIFVTVGLVGGLVRLVTGHYTDALHLLAIVGFGVFFGGGSLLMSLWGASQARADQAYLVEWLRVILPESKNQAQA